jgi:hypothetical protein
MEQFLDRDDPATMGQKVELGECRRNPPNPVVVKVEDGAGPTISGRWALVASDEFCGEWQTTYN